MDGNDVLKIEVEKSPSELDDLKMMVMAHDIFMFPCKSDVVGKELQFTKEHALFSSHRYSWCRVRNEITNISRETYSSSLLSAYYWHSRDATLMSSAALVSLLLFVCSYPQPLRPLFTFSIPNTQCSIYRIFYSNISIKKANAVVFGSLRVEYLQLYSIKDILINNGGSLYLSST